MYTVVCISLISIVFDSYVTSSYRYVYSKMVQCTWHFVKKGESKFLVQCTQSSSFLFSNSHLLFCHLGNKNNDTNIGLKLADLTLLQNYNY